jgi:hypothetical protein
LELSRFRYPTLKAVATVTSKDAAAILEGAIERARERSSGAKVISLVPKAIEHDAAELKPDANSFKRRF